MGFRPIRLLAGAVKGRFPERTCASAAVRRNRETYHLSTSESVAQALGIVEGDARARALFDFYRRATDRILLVPGKLTLRDVYGGFDRPAE